MLSLRSAGMCSRRPRCKETKWSRSRRCTRLSVTDRTRRRLIWCCWLWIARLALAVMGTSDLGISELGMA
eukprot:1010881-Prymnesium_polylepis.1